MKNREEFGKGVNLMMMFCNGMQCHFQIAHWNIWEQNEQKWLFSTVSSPRTPYGLENQKSQPVIHFTAHWVRLIESQEKWD